MKKSIVIKIRRLTMVLSVGLIFLHCSCSRNKTWIVPVYNLTLSGCLSNNDKSPNNNLSLAFEDGELQLTHDIYVNCALSITDIDASHTDNEININYITDGDNSTNCLCNKEIHYILQKIPVGTYDIIICIDGIVIYHQIHTLS